MGWKSPGILLLALVSLAPGSCNKDSGGTAAEPAPGIVLASEGVPRLNIFVATGEPPGTLLTAAVTDLDQALATIVGAPFQTTVAAAFPASDPGAGIYVGLATDASWVEAPSLDVEDCLLRTTPSGQVLLLGGSERGVAHAVYGFLEKLGCRWYFPGQTWAVIPRRSTLSIAFDERQSPDLAFQRSIWMGHGMHTPEISRDFGDWQRRNRMGGPMPLSTAHSWPGIDPATDFATHPEWFALVNGVRQASKPCYANPEVVARGIQRAISYFEANPSASMISVSAPDGLGYCEDDMCRQLAGVESVYTAYDALYGRRPDGTEVCVTSETIFAYANQVADAVAERFPGKYVGCLAYSAYAHPPSFSLRPNIYIQITTGYRRTPLTLGQQMVAFASKCPNIGIYEYYDVEQWSWEKPGAARAARLDYLQSSIRFFARAGLRSVRGEMSNNWAPNGIGYYALSRLMWDSATDVRTVEEDFYQGAFGPAAEALRRFFRRWESGQGMNPRTLALAHRDLQEATQSTADTPEIHARVDAIRMYLHFLAHYVQPNTSGSVTALVTQYGEEGARQRVDYLGRYVRKLINTHMIHS
ncbi:MAG: DUF4838 domain-containing protein, partial [Planctomycetes bacterium]|nr:DUF4838 domain-containing protein [Planctomycetota bacterium]